MFIREMVRLPFFVMLLALAACGTKSVPRPAPPEVGVVTLRLEPAVLTSVLPGRVVAIETSEVRPQISGVIRRRLFEEGAIVRAGQVLYEIEDAPYRAALGSAQGGLARAQAAIDATRLQAERYEELLKSNAVSRQDADDARAMAAQAVADVTAQRAAVEAASINLQFTRIRAPISGRIGRSLFTPGALVQAGQEQPLALIQRSDTVYVDVTQSASAILDLRETLLDGAITDDNGSAPVKLWLPNGKIYPIEGRLQFSEISADPSTGSVTLRASFDNPRGLLFPGMYVRAEMVEGVRRQAILVPQQAITRDARGREFALVVGVDDKVEQRGVSTANAVGNRWVVLDGLSPGERVVVDGRQRAVLGAAVTPQPWDPGAAATGLGN